MRVTIFGKSYQIVFVSRLPKTRRADIDPPHVPDKRIRIKRGLSEQETLEVIIHECLHAADWTKTEEWVTEVADDISKILWKLGYRRAELEDDPA